MLTPPRRLWFQCSVDMKPQFYISTLLISTAFVAITVGAWIAMRERTDYNGPTTMDLVSLLPYCMPFAFCGYAFGKRSASVVFLIAFVIAEAIAVVVGAWAWNH